MEIKAQGAQMLVSSFSETSNSIYFQEKFLAFLEQHLRYIKSYGLDTVNISETNAYKHEGNFYGIMEELNIPNYLHYVCMRVNGLLNSNQYTGESTIIYIPKFELIEQLKNQYLTSIK